MSAEKPSDPLDDPGYLRETSRRLRKIMQTLEDPKTRKELAAYSLQLAQRAETIARSTVEDPAIVQMNIEFYRSMLKGQMAESDKQTIEELLRQAEQTLNGGSTLRELAAWYRAFAERAGNPAIWEARLRTADDLDAEADRIERCLGQARTNSPARRDGG